MRLWQAGAALVLAGFLIAFPGRGEVNMHIPPTPDPATTAASPLDLPSYQINIAPAVKIPVRMPALLQSACRAGGKRISACTYFAEEKLDCRCDKTGGIWQLQVVVSFVPVMYLQNERYAGHEQLHIDDVTGMLRDHLEELASLRFDSEDSCTVAAQRQTGEFTELMNGFRRESNRRLH